MTQRAIREFDGKQILQRYLSKHGFNICEQMVLITPSTKLEEIEGSHPWLNKIKLVAKPDQLIKKRGKQKLLLLDASWKDAIKWITERRGKPITVQKLTDKLEYFIVEPFLPHKQKEEFYVCIRSSSNGDEILFHHEGGIEIGDVDKKAVVLYVPIGEKVDHVAVKEKLLSKVPNEAQEILAKFICNLFECYTELHFAYLEINPIVVQDNNVMPLDLAARLDETAKFQCDRLWGDISFPGSFGRSLSPEEEYIDSIDAKTGASLKLTIINPKGRIWPMVAGGGASVIYADTICDLGMEKDLANYGEYSGDPSTSETYEYAKTILDLMTREKDPNGKILVIGGGIANFTDVGQTFTGIIKALREYKEKLLDHKDKIYVRRGGPNYREGLQKMRDFAKETGLPIEVYGPDSHLTSIIAHAFNKPVTEFSCPYLKLTPKEIKPPKPAPTPSKDIDKSKICQLLTVDTQAIIYGMQARAVQNMLDFDFVCGKKNRSVRAIVYPFAKQAYYREFYWGTTQILIPVFTNVAQALEKFPEVSTIVSFASQRSVFESTREFLTFEQIRFIALIAEGVPERYTKLLTAEGKKKGVTILGPATVGGVKAGTFRIGNSAGSLDSVVASKLFRPGHVAFVSRSGGLSNELNNIISRTTDGVYMGIAIGGDRYPGMNFLDMMEQYEADPNVAMCVLLGEVGGDFEYDVIEARKAKKLTKPCVAWCSGTAAKMFGFELQFGHAGALAQSEKQSAHAKNEAFKKAGFLVPTSFNEFANIIGKTFNDLVKDGKVIPTPIREPPNIPVDYQWARKLGLIRKPSSFISSISDERGDELIYAGHKLSKVVHENMGIGGVLGLLWFRKRLPDYATKFIELVLMVSADHGPCVSGAVNTIVAARAGKDLISSIVAGLLCIGPRFGGALDGAADQFSNALDTGLKPREFVDKMRKEKKLIMGIGHMIRSIHSPDVRVQLVKEFCLKNFPKNDVLNYALEVEQVTTKKKGTLILNVDGCIAVCFVDLLRSSGAFTPTEAKQYIKMGALNGLFVVARAIGFTGHYLDQVRLRQPLFRMEHSEVSYLSQMDTLE